MRKSKESQLSFADLEFQRQGIVLDETLQAISDFLDERGELVEMVRQDLVRGLKNPGTGRGGLNAERVLRSFILQRVKNWDYRELRERIAEGYLTRLFSRFRTDPVPKHDAFNRAFNRLTPETVRAINDAVIQAAVSIGIEDGDKLRVDTTVVETDIHHPTDATLLWDSVRVITRLTKRLTELLPEATGHFPDRTRRARRRMQEISRLKPAQRGRKQKGKYRDLLKVTGEVVEEAREAVRKAKGVTGLDPVQSAIVQAACKEIEQYCALADRVVDQARRRVLEGEAVPVEEKVFSIFEPHTGLIMRGKTHKPVEFGHKVFLAESGIGLITDYRVLDGNPSDEGHVRPSLERHTETFGAAPDLYAGDRGFYSAGNIGACDDAGVGMTCIPQRGGTKTAERKAYEKSPAFKKGQRFRAGVEGRISVLFRGRGMKRCLLNGRERFEMFVGAAVLANNLMVIAARLSKVKGVRRRHRKARPVPAD